MKTSFYKKFNINIIKKKYKSTPFLLLIISFIIIIIINFFYKKTTEKKIYIGCLYSETGIMGEFEKPNYDILVKSLKYVVDRENINIKIIPLYMDLKSDDNNYIKWIEHCVKNYNVKYFFGCWKSSTRKAVLDTLKKYNVRLFYPLQYEGVECDQNVYYFGSTPNQQIIPAIDYYFSKYQKIKDVYIIGSDYVYPRVAADIIKNYMEKWTDKLHKNLKYISFHSLTENNYTDIINKIYNDSPNGAIVINNINGDSLYKFFEQFYNIYYKNNNITFDKKYREDPLKFINSFNDWNNNYLENQKEYENFNDNSFSMNILKNNKKDKQFNLNFKIYNKYPIISFSLPENNINKKYNKYLYATSSCWSFMSDIIINPMMYVVNIENKKVKSDIKFLKSINNKIVGDTQYCTFLSILFFVTVIKKMINNNEDINDVDIYNKNRLVDIITVTGEHSFLKDNHINKPFYCGYFDENNKFFTEYDSLKLVDPDPFYNIAVNSKYNIYCEGKDIFIRNSSK
jgi:hypothetical protein